MSSDKSISKMLHDLGESLVDGFADGSYPNDDMFKPRRVEVVETNQRFESIRACARSFKTEPSNVRNCLRNPKRTLYGYHLRAIDDYED